MVEEDGVELTDAGGSEDQEHCEIDIDACPLHSRTGETGLPSCWYGFMGWVTVHGSITFLGFRAS